MLLFVVLTLLFANNAILCDFPSVEVDRSSICRKYEEIERRFECGVHGYPMSYGHKNCMIFNNNTTRRMFSPEGKIFLDCATKCLMKKFITITETSTTCDQLHDKAFRSHVDCYQNCDFCEICKTDKTALMKSYDWSDFLSTDAVRQVYAIMRNCGLFTCFI